ncbi:hypothetical protein BJY01DRAFT_238543 [Aspergillus pseudoustus]|uniref:Rhodopsin domain-containing protein n=1 Tax=Aspergillus pseudoustus TaxID=1810923 RepID=A0ABR4J795_9EURO
MVDQEPALQPLSKDNRGAIITLTSISLLIVAIIFVAAKFGSAIYFKQRRTVVNTPVWAALALAIIQVVLLQKAVDHGLGKHQNKLGVGDILAWNKFAYAAHILLIAVMSLSKMSTILLIWKLTPDKSLRRNCAIAAGIVVSWSIFALLVFNILTEIIIVALPFVMMRNVQMAWHKRVKILCSFSTRSSVLGLAIAHLALLPSFTHSTDISWDIVNWEIIGQTMTLTTVIIACIPTIYHIFAGLHSGLTTTQIPDEIGLELPQTKASGYINQSSSAASQSHSRSQSRGRSKNKKGRSMFDGRDANAGVITEVSSGGDLGRGEGDRQSGSTEGAESTRHLTQETQGQGGVLKTVDVTMSVEKQNHRDWI